VKELNVRIIDIFGDGTADYKIIIGKRASYCGEWHFADSPFFLGVKP
jgi:hypothetical protein